MHVVVPRRLDSDLERQEYVIAISVFTVLSNSKIQSKSVFVYTQGFTYYLLPPIFGTKKGK